MAERPSRLRIAFVAMHVNGGAFICTWNPGSKQVGWGRLTTNGVIKSMSVTQTAGSANVWALVIREDGFLYLERSTRSGSQTAREFVDSYVLSISETATDQITGVTHLANRTVGVTVDNAEHPDVTLDGNGDATLQFTGFKILVGLRYTSRFRSLPFDRGSPTGSSQSWKKRWNRIFTRIVESALPLVQGQRQPDRNPSTPMDTAEPLRTEDVETRSLGWDQFARVEIEQDLIAPLLITGVFGEMSEESL